MNHVESDWKSNWSVLMEIEKRRSSGLFCGLQQLLVAVWTDNNHLFDANKKEGLSSDRTPDKFPESSGRGGKEIPRNETFWEAVTPYPAAVQKNGARPRTEPRGAPQVRCDSATLCRHPLNHMRLVYQWLRGRTLLSGGYFPAKTSPPARYSGSS